MTGVKNSGRVSAFSFCRVIFPAIPILFLISSLSYSAGKYKDTVWIPVTFYDFHADKSNPEFECDHMSGRHLGMVADTLDSEGKPTLGPAPYINQYIKYWFRDWKAPGGGKGDLTRPHYTRTDAGTLPWSATIKYDSIQPVNYDTSFINTVIKDDSLPFLLVDAATGIYCFDRTKTNPDRNLRQFFNLDNRGFGNEPRGQNPSHNFAFTMQLHHVFTYQGDEKFTFSGDDDVWVFINGKLALDLGGIHEELTDSFTVTASKFNLTKNKDYSLDVFYAERHTSASNCKITTNIVREGPDTIDLKASSTTLPAGGTVDIKGKVLDDEGNELPEIADSIRWHIIPDSLSDPNDKLLDSIGAVTQLTATKAGCRTIKVEAMVADPNDPTNIKRAVVEISVVAGPPDHISIEASTGNPCSVKNERLGEILIQGTQNTAEAYAVVRDRFGNYVRVSDAVITSWSSKDTSVVTVTGETGRAYHGLITRKGYSDSTFVFASEGNLIPDSVKVKVIPWTIMRLKLMDSLTNKQVDTIRMTADDTGHYYVMGLTSNAVAHPEDPNSWINVNAKWFLSPPLLSWIDPSDNSHGWTYEPKNDGTGTLTLTNPSDANTPPLIVPVIITPGPPDTATITLITTEEKRIAGDTLLCVVRIFNKDKLPVSGHYCFGGPSSNDSAASKYYDNLGKGGRPYDPTVTVNGSSTNLNFNFPNPAVNYSLPQCFDDGIDTVKVVLFYAPLNIKDSSHVISVRLDYMTASTEPFVLKQAPLSSLKLVDDKFNEIPGPEILHSGEGFSAISAGYDRYGNCLGRVNSNWATENMECQATGSITNVDQYYFEACDVINVQAGKLCAAALGENGVISDCVDVTIYGSGAQVSSATTRDMSGDGYIDRFDLVFNKKVNFSNNYKDRISISFSYVNERGLKRKVDFIVDSIVPNSNDGTGYFLYVKQNIGYDSLPQSAWQPLITMQGDSIINNIDGLKAVDGCQPVIWKVVKIANSLTNHTKDVVSVYFSEKISGTNGSTFAYQANSPGAIFNVWEKKDGNFVKIDSMFSGIDQFSKITLDSVLEFRTSNGKDLNSLHYLNIQYEHGNVLLDKNNNYPLETNQKVNVVVFGTKISIQAFPNPCSPGFYHEGPGVFNLIHNSSARDWVIHQGQGVVLNIKLIAPANGSKIKGYLKIYDLVGNLVAYTSTDDLLRNIDVRNKKDEIIDVDVYWNGSCKSGMKAAPGVYQSILFLNYTDPSYKDATLVYKVGIRK